ncbi:uncharacterized protein I303_108309 [Kwoniella dejecticola CBS 10117]|uniref:F-box domain-containing protein n=1 Tax=Kwoniella dejecticola CBS 10117 TaxID=1296121 RepID=A0A1A5ZXR9_9TREE|nr:uncharacterized protein I303_07364 [Kwoniella dejecticola CBS 10117]OBR82602.1 hypothetical protein I303_07364 [Kwoniella dejecticola CBS 10117]
MVTETEAPRLPPEILRQVILSTNHPRTLYHLCMVNKYFHESAIPALYHTFTIDGQQQLLSFRDRVPPSKKKLIQKLRVTVYDPFVRSPENDFENNKLIDLKSLEDGQSAGYDNSLSRSITLSLTLILTASTPPSNRPVALPVDMEASADDFGIAMNVSMRKTHALSNIIVPEGGLKVLNLHIIDGQSHNLVGRWSYGSVLLHTTIDNMTYWKRCEELHITRAGAVMEITSHIVATSQLRSYTIFSRPTLMTFEKQKASIRKCSQVIAHCPERKEQMVLVMKLDVTAEEKQQLEQLYQNKNNGGKDITLRIDRLEAHELDLEEEDLGLTALFDGRCA